VVVDFVRPVQTVIPGTQGRILAVLAETSAELNLRTIARLSGVSLAQASRVLPTLVELGIVHRREAPPSALFRFVPENVAARVLTTLARARQTVLEELGRTAAELSPEPASVIVFGSFARDEADMESDLDVVVVRAAGVDEDDGVWRFGVDQWRERAHRLTGNRVEVIEVGELEIGRLLRGRKPLWLDVQREGVVVFGAALVALKGRRSA
jgi:predicted nucleotidyltransferase